MTVFSEKIGNSEIHIETGAKLTPQNFEVMEKKGWGHPDKMADDLAEQLSCDYAKMTLEKCGVVLHHNFDKLCLLGGSSKVKYGSAEMEKPIRVLVNGRTTNSFNGVSLNVDNFIIYTCKKFFKNRLPLVDVDKHLSIELNLSTASSSGRVFADFNESENPRHRWFSPKSIDDLPERKRLHSNDTSLGTGYAPLTKTEKLIKKLTNYLSYRPRKGCPAWMGTDVKVMACRTENYLDITSCVPQIAQYVQSRKEYCHNLQWLYADIKEFLTRRHPEMTYNLTLNARDNLAKDEIYLTATGSSIESGDEGIVGRGNRVNGLITPMRSMNLEGANGKNPIYHVGKLYNVLAIRMSERLSQMYHSGVCVNLISKTGQNLLEPWKIVIQFESSAIDKNAVVEKVVELMTLIPDLTQEIISNKMELS